MIVLDAVHPNCEWEIPVGTPVTLGFGGPKVGKVLHSYVEDDKLTTLLAIDEETWFGDDHLNLSISTRVSKPLNTIKISFSADS